MDCAKIMQKGKEAVKVDVLLNETTLKAPILDVSLMIDWTYMTENVLIILTWIPTLTVRNHRMHPELCIFILLD
jgi:hypothetical protein